MNIDHTRCITVRCTSSFHGSTIFVMTFALESFFESHEACVDFWEKLVDRNEEKYVLVLVGAGGNGKSQLCNQLLSMSPTDYYSVVHEGNKIPEKGPARKILYVTNDSYEEAKKFSYDVVQMSKKF